MSSNEMYYIDILGKKKDADLHETENFSLDYVSEIKKEYASLYNLTETETDLLFGL